AYRIATTEPAGPVYLCYDAGLQEDEIGEQPISVDQYVNMGRPTPVQADPAALARAAEMIVAAARPVIVTEFTGRHPDAFTELVAVQPVALSLTADTRLALPELRRLVRERTRGRDTSARRREIAARHDAMVDAWERDAKADWADAPMTAPRLASDIWSVIKNDDWVLTANTLEDWALRLWNMDSPARHPGRSFGTATQIAVSLGVGESM